jgi:formate hydrogenlyase subunit 3/multisubunit Na+/H+ antiporter MnhD subunit
MSTNEIVILWCVVSYAIAWMVFMRKYARKNSKKIDESDLVYVALAPVVVPVAAALIIVLAPPLEAVILIQKRRLSKLRGKDENES